MITKDELQKQIVATEAELEQVKSHLYRCDGAIQVLKHLLKTFDKADEVDDGSN